jgi:outer membrane receptor for Fe3+-dicitrate
MLSAQWGVEYRHRKRWFTSLTGRHDSGLVTEIHDLDEIRADPDLAFGLDFVDLESEPHRVKARTVWNWMAGATLFEDRRHRMDFQLTVLNLANRRGLFNFLSVFGGTHVIPPRTVAARLVLHF